MLNNNEKDLLLKLLMEKATGTDRVNLQLVQHTTQIKRKGAGRGRRPKGVRVWSQEEHNFLKESIAAGITQREIAKLLDRTVKAVETRLWMMKHGRVAS
jgi:hypothetical protein